MATSSARSAAPASTGAPRSCSMPPGSRCSRPSCRCRSGRICRARSPAAAFDAEGVATRDRELVRDGVLDGYVLGSYSARKLGLDDHRQRRRRPQPAGQRAGGPAHDFAGLLARMGTGLYVTELMGQGVNGVTGDYSRGASGFWVEDGAIAYPVHEITIAGNLRDMYRGIVARRHRCRHARRDPLRLGAGGRDDHRRRVSGRAAITACQPDSRHPGLERALAQPLAPRACRVRRTGSTTAAGASVRLSPCTLLAARATARISCSRM